MEFETGFSTDGDFLPPEEILPPGMGRCGAGQAADILALARAAYDSMSRVLRSAPEVRANRIMSRWPIDVESLLGELEFAGEPLPIAQLGTRLGVSSAQVRSTVLRLQRLGLLDVQGAGVALTGQGRQKLARLEMARTSVIQRLASGLANLSSDEAERLLGSLKQVIEQADGMAELQFGDAR